MKTITAVLLGCAMAAALSADTLRLSNGSRVSGTFLGGDSREVKFLTDDGGVKSYSVGDVAGIDFRDSASSSAAISSPSPSAPVAPSASRAASTGALIPAGTVISVRTIDTIDSDVTGVGERFRASLDEAIVVNGQELAPRGANAVLQVARIEQAGTLRGKDEVALELASIEIDGRSYEIQTNFAEVESKGKGGRTAKTAGGGAALGAIIGAIAGGGKGAAVGAGVGAGAGTVYSATRGERVKVPSETLLTFSLRNELRL